MNNMYSHCKIPAQFVQTFFDFFFFWEMITVFIRRAMAKNQYFSKFKQGVEFEYL